MSDEKKVGLSLIELYLEYVAVCAIMAEYEKILNNGRDGVKKSFFREMEKCYYFSVERKLEIIEKFLSDYGITEQEVLFLSDKYDITIPNNGGKNG